MNGYANNMRGIGAADLACALLTDCPYRCHSGVAFRVLDVVQKLHEASEHSNHLQIESSCE